MMPEISFDLDQLADAINFVSKRVLYSKSKDDKAEAKESLLLLQKVVSNLDKDNIHLLLLKSPYYEKYLFPRKKHETGKEENYWD